jgi:hypothetical protein
VQSFVQSWYGVASAVQVCAASAGGHRQEQPCAVVPQHMKSKMECAGKVYMVSPVGVCALSGLEGIGRTKVVLQTLQYVIQ